MLKDHFLSSVFYTVDTAVSVFSYKGSKHHSTGSVQNSRGERSIY